MPKPRNKSNGDPNEKPGGNPDGEGAGDGTNGEAGGQTGEGANGETALATAPEGPVYQTLSATAEEMNRFIQVIKTNLAGEKITDRDLDRITLPAGGSRQWEVPTIEGSEYTDTLDGIIIHQTPPRAYWKKDLDEGGGGTPPDCSSPDGERGFFSIVVQAPPPASQRFGSASSG